jgi:hypothetical protein
MTFFMPFSEAILEIVDTTASAKAHSCTRVTRPELYLRKREAGIIGSGARTFDPALKHRDPY